MYITLDADDHINENADLAPAADKQHWEAQHAKNADGKAWISGWKDASFGDCWIKTHAEPDTEWLSDLAENEGVSVDHLSVSGPGTHPGGNAWWINITALVQTPVWSCDE